MLLENGEKVLVVHRRLFFEDDLRVFTGIVEAYQAGVARVRGYTWVRDQTNGGFFRRDELRMNVISLSSGSLLLYTLPDELNLQDMRVDSDDNQLLLSDGQGFRMNLIDPDSRPRKFIP